MRTQRFFYRIIMIFGMRFCLLAWSLVWTSAIHSLSQCLNSSNKIQSNTMRFMCDASSSAIYIRFHYHLSQINQCNANAHQVTNAWNIELRSVSEFIMEVQVRIPVFLCLFHVTSSSVAFFSLHFHFKSSNLQMNLNETASRFKF